MNHLNSSYSVCRFYLWSDSKVALSWISSDKDLKDVYVVNQVAETKVLASALDIQLFHASTTDNPVDLLSQGCSVEKLKSRNWMHGPDWLITREYPNQDVSRVVVNELVVEIKPVAPDTPLLDLSRFSKYTEVIRIMSRILQFLKLNLDPFETLVMQEQKLHCNSTYTYLSNSNIQVNTEVKTTIKELNLQLVNKAIRTHGRLLNSDLPLDARTPLFLPNRPKLLELLIIHLHTTNNQCGLSHTLSLYRQQVWTPKIRSCAKSVLFRCLTCRKLKVRKVARPLPPPLSHERVSWVAQLAAVGIDHMGHISYRDISGQ